MIKYTPQLLKKIEDVFTDNGYSVRYEKGNFKSGYCIIEDRKMIMINKFSVIESRVNTLLEILRIISPQMNWGEEGKHDQIKKIVSGLKKKQEEVAE
jgi:hypothetical protein